jgi:hypothetical protein
MQVLALVGRRGSSGSSGCIPRRPRKRRIPAPNGRRPLPGSNEPDPQAMQSMLAGFRRSMLSTPKPQAQLLENLKQTSPTCGPWSYGSFTCGAAYRYQAELA